MDNKIILTIGRQFGSGGREVGQKLAKALGIAYYDKELMAVAAKESGLSEEFSKGGRARFERIVLCFYDGVFIHGDVYALQRYPVQRRAV